MVCLLLPYIQGTVHSVRTKVVSPFSKPCSARFCLLALPLDSQRDPRHPRLAPNFAIMQQYSCHFESLPGLSSRPSPHTTGSVSPEDASRSWLWNSAAFHQTTRRHTPEASAVRTSVFACFRNTQTHTLLPKSAACNVIKTEKSPGSGPVAIPVVHPVSGTSHQLHVAAPISSVADRDVSLSTLPIHHRLTPEQRAERAHFVSSYKMSLHRAKWHLHGLHTSKVPPCYSVWHIAIWAVWAMGSGPGDRSSIPVKGRISSLTLLYPDIHCRHQNMWSFVAAPAYNIEMLGAL